MWLIAYPDAAGTEEKILIFVVRCFSVKDQGNYDEAKKSYDQCLEIEKKLGNQSGMAAILHILGNIEYLKGNYDEAKKLYSQSLEITQKLGDQSALATTLAQLGVLLESEGKLTEAEEYVSRALDIFNKLDDKPSQGKATRHLIGIREKLKKT